ncbi:MAG: DUF1080 domain-containing protein [Candidatus Poribacteria bacterium]|nr:DUF1080 domain-containing protein [Candidatus Poribacteria bacterium]
MRTWKRTLVMLTAAALTAGASAGTRTWDFSLNASLKEWTLTEWNDVEWKVRSARLFMTDKAPGYAIVGDTDWEDYVVEAKIRGKAKNFGFGILFRVQYESASQFQYYAFELSVLNNQIIFKRGYKSGGSGGASATHRTPRGITLEADKWYTVRAHILGDRFQFYIDGERQYSVQSARHLWWSSIEDRKHLAKGAVGFFSDFAEGELAYLSVTGRGIENDVYVHPGSKLAAQWAQLKLD